MDAGNGQAILLQFDGGALDLSPEIKARSLPSLIPVLVRVASGVGLDGSRAQSTLSSDEYAADMREREAFYASCGISAVPSVIDDDRHLIQGGQPVETFEQVLRQWSQAA